MALVSENWIKHIESLVIQSLDLSMWGSFPAFSWEEFSSHISTALNVRELKLYAGGSEWKNREEILSGLGETPLQLAIALSPLQGSCSILFPIEDVTKLSSWIIHSEAQNEGFVDFDLQKGFFRYLCLEVLSIFSSMDICRGLKPRLVDQPLADEDAYCIDVAVEYKEETIWGRLVCPVSFQQSFKVHFSQDWNLSLRSHLYQDVFLELSLNAGQTKMSQDAWSKVDIGDFMLIDSCSYYPELKKGTFQMQCRNIPLFQVKIKEESIKILDYAYYFEDQKMGNENLEESFDESVEDDIIEEPSTQDPPQQEFISPKKIPISLTVEVAKIRINLDNLLKLRPGNVLELGVHPEKSVNLVADGACVGQGELVQIGDVVGVKIIKLGK